MKTLARLEESRRNKEKTKTEREVLSAKITATVLAHGGPCINEADVNKVFASGKCQMNILKEEIRNVRKVLGKTDPRLIMAKKSFDCLRADFISYLGSVPPTAVPGHPPPGAPPTPAPLKRKKT